MDLWFLFLNIWCLGLEASARVLHATKPVFRSLREQIFANRGITCGSTVRRSPNCFQLLRQCEVLSNGGFGSADEAFQVSWWSSDHSLSLAACSLVNVGV